MAKVILECVAKYIPLDNIFCDDEKITKLDITTCDIGFNIGTDFKRIFKGKVMKLFKNILKWWSQKPEQDIYRDIAQEQIIAELKVKVKQLEKVNTGLAEGIRKLETEKEKR